MDNRTQYLSETDQRYQKFIHQFNEKAPSLRNSVVTEQQNTERQLKAVSNKLAYMEQPTLTMERYTPAKFKVHNVVIDSAFRDTSVYPSANDFVLKLVEPIRNVVAIRLLRSEFAEASATNGYFVINSISIPLQTYTLSSAYLYLNSWTSLNIANDSSTQFFGRIGPGTEIYPAVSGDPTLDPYVFIMNPVEPKLRRFHLKLMNADQSMYAVADARVVLTLAVYCLQ